jgi:hypothetical protein
MWDLAIILSETEIYIYKVSQVDIKLAMATKRENEDWVECWLRYLEAPDERRVDRQRVCLHR